MSSSSDTPQEPPRLTMLVALDGSPAAATVLPLARTVAAQLGAGLAILHVAETVPSEKEARRQLHLGKVDDAAELRLLTGDPVVEILRVAADPGVSLIALTTHGRAVEQGRALGRTAEAVIAGVERPILLVRPEAAAPSGAVPALKRLLMPLDGTPSTAVALRPATELARRLGAAVDLLYVADPSQERPREKGSIGVPRYIDQPQHEWPQWANEVIARLAGACAACPPEVPVQMYLAQGEVGPEVARFAAEHQAGAIVLVRHSRLEPGRASHLRAILDLTPCPILLLGGSPV